MYTPRDTIRAGLSIGYPPLSRRTFLRKSGFINVVTKKAKTGLSFIYSLTMNGGELIVGFAFLYTVDDMIEIPYYTKASFFFFVPAK